ncbi:MAG: glycosyltransferase [Spartobacteria bacterium]|nr:glycosyltransferase [Spartobacteria bacterium]
MFVGLISCLLIIIYIYIGYPALISLWSKLCCKSEQDECVFSGCTVVIAAHNEATHAERKLHELLSGDNGRMVQRIVVISDCSDDGTTERIRSLNDPRIHLIEQDIRSGKSACLNIARQHIISDAVVMMDMRQRVPDGCIRALLERLGHEQVGVVSGELLFGQTDGASAAKQGMGVYWHYEKWIRRREAQTASVPGATGACYAIRHNLWKAIPASTLLDDVAIPMQAVMQGFRCVFEERAVVYDSPSQHSAQESVRKRRTLAGNVQLAILFPELLLPWRNPIWIQYVSHKIMRLTSPFVILTALILTISGLFRTTSGMESFFFKASGLGELVFLLCGLTGLYMEYQGRKNVPKIFAISWMFMMLNWITLLGVIDGLRGKHTATWNRAYTNQN